MTHPLPDPMSRYREEAEREVRADRAPINIAIAERLRVAVEKLEVMPK
jgi:hypothetical protein